MMAGGHSQEKQVDGEHLSLFKGMQGPAQSQLGKTYSHWEPKTYTTQVVAGTNFKVKVEVDNGEYVFIKVFQPLPHTGESAQLKEAHGGKSAGDAF